MDSSFIEVARTSRTSLEWLAYFVILTQNRSPHGGTSCGSLAPRQSSWTELSSRLLRLELIGDCVGHRDRAIQANVESEPCLDYRRGKKLQGYRCHTVHNQRCCKWLQACECVNVARASSAWTRNNFANSCDESHAVIECNIYRLRGFLITAYNMWLLAK